MKFQNKKEIGTFNQLMEGLGFRPSISSNELMQVLNELPNYVSRYSVDFTLWNNELVLSLYNTRKTIELVIRYVKA